MFGKTSDSQEEKRIFEIFGTGHTIYCDMGVDRRYIGTFQIENGQFIGHVFERIN